MQDVTPLPKVKTVSAPEVKPPLSPKPRKRNTAGVPHANHSVARKDPVVSQGLDRRTDEKLRKGKMPIEARLDLHGHTRRTAQDALTRFILECYHTQKRSVLVITGKGQEDPLCSGKGVLKQAVPEWLSEPPCQSLILKTYPARPRDGGSGALYVLLRRKRDI